MSTIVCLKEKNTVVLGTDSRFMKHDFSGVSSDAEQKVYEIAPATFIATSGWKMVCDFQETKATELAEKLGTHDIRIIGDALERESLSCLKELVEILSPLRHLHEKIAQALQGDVLVHSCVLAGRAADGKLGYVKQSYRVRAGQVVNEPGEYFGGERKIFITAGDPAVSHVAPDPMIWTNRPVRAVQRILATLKRACPVIGGPDQIVCLDRSGARWISPPPVKETATTPVGELAVATANFAGDVTFTRAGSPGSVTINSTGVQVNQGSLNGGSLSISTGSGVVSISASTTGVSIVSGAYNSYHGYNVLNLADASGIAQLTTTSLTVGNPISPAIFSASTLKIPGLPSYNPGAGSKQFWYDPADGNRVKFAA